MVGGYVIEVVDKRDEVYVNCRAYGTRLPDGTVYGDKDECAVFLERCPASLAIELGDSLWWQGPNAYWAPKGERGQYTDQHDVRIKKLRYSGRFDAQGNKREKRR